MNVAPNAMNAALDSLELAYPERDFAIFARDENSGDEYMIVASKNEIEFARTGWCPTPCIAKAEMVAGLKAIKRNKH